MFFSRQVVVGRGQCLWYAVSWRQNHPGRAEGGQRRARGPQRCAASCRRVNVGCGPAEERVLLTGLHAVADIYCENCKTTLGWKYVSTVHSASRRGPHLAQ